MSTWITVVAIAFIVLGIVNIVELLFSTTFLEILGYIIRLGLDILTVVVLFKHSTQLAVFLTTLLK